MLICTNTKPFNENEFAAVENPAHMQHFFSCQFSWLLGSNDISKMKQITNLAWQAETHYVWEENVFILCFLFVFT